MSAYRLRLASRSSAVVAGSYSHGSRRFVSMCECARKNGWYAPAWYHLVMSSASGYLKNPPTSDPQKLTPATASDRHIGTDTARKPHSAALSPVHTAAYLCVPAKVERVSMKGRYLLSTRLCKPSLVARMFHKPYSLWMCLCSQKAARPSLPSWGGL
ncbi:unnamed protein product [Chrysodeixis includens]|uniref:Uncharacterized protein n=1 Tax=Chrysodeixis includens TaxID=689277 RepID=A0A9N8L5W4_CHRIL|nr:unnamed protein product [Chrysodeixis includens]